MTTAEAQIAAPPRLSDGAQRDTGQHRRAGGAVSDRWRAAACGGENPANAWAAGDISASDPTWQPSRHRRAPPARVARWAGWHVASDDRITATPAGGTGGAVAPAAGLVRAAGTVR